MSLSGGLGAATVGARSARLLHGVRLGQPDGPFDRTEHPEEGAVDFAHRRVHYRSTIFGRKQEYPGERLWDGANRYSRDSAAHGWTKLPLPEEQGGKIPFGSPFFLLDGLYGARDDAQVIAEEQIRAAERGEPAY